MNDESNARAHPWFGASKPRPSADETPEAPEAQEAPIYDSLAAELGDPLAADE